MPPAASLLPPPPLTPPPPSATCRRNCSINEAANVGFCIGNHSPATVGAVGVASLCISFPPFTNVEGSATGKDIDWYGFCVVKPVTNYENNSNRRFFPCGMRPALCAPSDASRRCLAMTNRQPAFLSGDSKAGRAGRALRQADQLAHDVLVRISTACERVATARCGNRFDPPQRPAETTSRSLGGRRYDRYRFDAHRRGR